jgi:hypothetical protein
MGEAFVINGQPIPGWCWGRVLNACSGDRYLAGRVFYRARAAKNIMRWIMSGLKTGYAFLPRGDESEGGQAVREWIDANILRVPETTPGAAGELVAGLADRMGMPK